MSSYWPIQVFAKGPAHNFTLRELWWGVEIERTTGATGNTKLEMNDRDIDTLIEALQEFKKRKGLK